MQGRFWPIIGIFSLALAGCAGNDVIARKQVEMEGNLERLVQANTAMNNRMARLAESMKDLQTQMKVGGGDQEVFSHLKKSEEEMQQRLSELKQGLAQLQQAQAPHGSAVQQDAAQQSAPRQVPSASAVQVSAAAAPGEAHATLEVATVGGQQAVTKPVASAKVAPDKMTPTPRLTGKDAYAKAYALFSAGNYSGAAEAFAAFVLAEPSSEWAPNAYYWSGECYYTQNQYPQALKAFNKVVSGYPKAPKVPDALLKIGFTQISMNDQAKAKVTLRSVIEKYPKTPAAAKARQRLAHI